MDLDLATKTAVVTGASRGIGLATVRTLMNEGVRVLGAARTITAELKETGAHTVSADLSTEQGAATLVDSALAELGGIHLLVNNVGGSSDQPAGFIDTDDAEWTRLFDLNVRSTVRITRAALPSLIERQGAIVNVSSIAALRSGPVPVAYGATKAALNALSKSLAEEFGPQGVRVNTVSPGVVRTSVWEASDGPVAQAAADAGMDHAEFLDQLPKAFGITTGRMAEPEEVAGLIAFLLSDVAGNVTGANYLIDGGAIKAV